MEIVRVQFEMPRHKAEELEALMEQIGVQTKKELFNNALTLLKWAVRETQRGNSIASVDEVNKKYKEIHMPILDDVDKNIRSTSP